jgi:hypothetical protein
MSLKRLGSVALALVLSAGTIGASLAQTGTSGSAGNTPGSSRPAPSVDTGAAGTDKFPVTETKDPRATGSVGNGASANPLGNPSGTIDPTPNAAISSGASGRNKCFPGQTGQSAGSSNPAGQPSQC